MDLELPKQIPQANNADLGSSAESESKNIKRKRTDRGFYRKNAMVVKWSWSQLQNDVIADASA
jgi:hypothetical protein